MRYILCAIVGLWFIGVVTSDYPATNQAEALTSQQRGIDAKGFRELRDQAIKNIGWVAGNARAHPVWAEVEQYVGRGGKYYDVLIRLKTPGSSSDFAEAHSNLSLYNEWVKVGEKQPFSERESVTRIQRANQIVAELTQMMNAAGKN
jgi:hypothetical protein